MAEDREVKLGAEKEGFRLLAVVDEKKVIHVEIDKIFISYDGNPIPVAVFLIEGRKLVVIPTDGNGNPIEDPSKHRNVSLSAVMSDKGD